MTFVPPDTESLRQATEQLAHSASLVHVGPTAPVAQTGGVKVNLPDWKEWFDTTNKLHKIWNGSVWITIDNVWAEVVTNQADPGVAYGDMATVGPAVTIDTGTTAEISWGGFPQTPDALSSVYAAFAVSGATTIAAADANAVWLVPANATTPAMNIARTKRLTTLTPGTNTFTLKYKHTGNAGTYANRWISVRGIPA